jgi:hypothetical protein
MLTTLFAALALAAPPDTIPQRWEFHDAATFNGRPLLTYCPVELSAKPPRPVHPDDDPGPNVRYGLLPVGNHLDGYRFLIWLPDAAGGPELWIDANGDGRFTADERHRIAAQPAEIPITISLKVGSFARYVSRTILVRATADGGLRYAVRGYAAGPLLLAGWTYGAIVSDGNGDGCFDSPAADRVWIDLDGDGRFDALTEQFPLGSPVKIGGRLYLIKPAADGTSVFARERPNDQGAIRLVVAGQNGQRPQALSAQLVSDWGELVTLSAASRTRLPVGRYTIETLAFRLEDDDGRTWSYRFAGDRRFDVVVESGKEALVRPLDKLTFSAAVKLPQTGVTVGTDLPVTPALRTPVGLELINCDVTGRDQRRAAESEAEIRLEAPDGKAADSKRSGFV